MAFAILQLDFSCLILNKDGSLTLAKRIPSKILPEFYTRGLVVKDITELELFISKANVLNVEPISSFDVPTSVSLKLFLHSKFDDDDIQILYFSLKLNEPGSVSRFYEFLSSSLLPRGDMDFKLISESYFNRFYDFGGYVE